MDVLEENGECFLRMDSPILHVPADNREEFFGWLLQLSQNLVEAAFSVSGDDLDNSLSVDFGAKMWATE